MRDPELRPISELAYINPGRVPIAGGPETSVSFIPMADVSESGEWTNHKVRRLREVSSGYTAFAEGDVLFAKITPCMENGKGAHALGLINGVGFGTTEFHVVRAREGISDSRYLYHWLQSRELRLKAESFMIGSAGQQRVQPSLFRHFTIPDFPLPEQRRIARVLDTVDAAIRQTEAVIAKLKQVKAGLLHDLLTRGLDENGELRDPVRHPEQFKDSPLGRVPKEWEVVRLAHILDSIDAGKSPDCPDRPASYEEWGVLKVSSVRTTGLQEDENKVIVDRAHIRPQFEVKHGDLLITRANTYELVGMSCLVQSPRPRLLLCDKTLRLNVKPSRARSDFVFYMLQMPSSRAQIEMHATGSSGSMKNISQATIRQLQVRLSSIEEQHRIASVVSNMDAQLSEESRKREKLIELKQGLMQDLLTGRVRVPEEAVEGVAA